MQNLSQHRRERGSGGGGGGAECKLNILIITADGEGGVGRSSCDDGEGVPIIGLLTAAPSSELTLSAAVARIDDSSLMS